ncbi:NAD(P)H-dependent oxidoreductase [Kineococcus sp. NUM-3379]
MSVPHTLVVVGHPDLATSRVHRALADEAAAHPGVTVHDLGALAPRGGPDVETEKELLRAHERVVLQFPVHWFGVPALLKQWIDTSLAFGFAYGPGGDALQGKTLHAVLSTGMPAADYSPGGRATRSLDDLLSPLSATAEFTGMRWAAPLVLHGTRWLTDEQLARHVADYAALLDEQPALAA